MVKYRGNSFEFSLFFKKFLKSGKKNLIMTRIIILAAGKGTRMNSELPKVLVPLNGRPMIKYLMDSVVAAKVDQKPIVVVSPDNKEIISEALKEYNVEYAIQDKQLGTGHAVACTQEVLEQAEVKVDKIIVLYGDHPFLKSESIKKFASLSPEAVTIMPTNLIDFAGWRQNFYRWGRIICGANSKVEKIVEFKDASEEEKLVTKVNPGFMCFNSAWFFKNVSDLKNNNNQQEYYLTDMISIAFDQGHEVGTLDIEAHEAMGVNSLEELTIAESLLA
jgi:bifunctional UDP-N-acetylglucosamine pyrophosphorylase/glucosamine-1-phosphate N-acetyltransferase